MIIKEVKRLREKVTKKWVFDNPKKDTKEFVKELINKDTKEFAKELIDAMWSHSGLGISANQIGHNYRVFAMRGETKRESIVCFNPEIKDFSPEMNTMEEGCLSLPDVFARVVRPAHVAISYLTEDGKEEGQLASGMTARVFQHELDHLDGILFTDRLGNLARERAFEKARKIQKFRARGKSKYQNKQRFAL